MTAGKMNCREKWL